MQNIRNFCIIAHIDHGKSTLADRFLELTGTVEGRHMHEQYLDQMELERERGITIKLQPVRMIYSPEYATGKNNPSVTPEPAYMLNLIDTPGHVDFSYEVSRSLAAVEGAVLLVDAAKGVQAQTLANFNLAAKQGLAVIPAINKIDLPGARTAEVESEIEVLLSQYPDLPRTRIFKISAKTGQGVNEVLRAIIENIPPPGLNKNQKYAEGKTRALVFDSDFDDFKGIIAYVRMFGGMAKSGAKARFLASGTSFNVIEVGHFAPNLTKDKELAAGEIGYIATGLKEPSLVRVGDTMAVLTDTPPLPGYKTPEPMVFASFYTENNEEYDTLKDALSKIKLTDASLSYEPESSPGLGRGFRLGFLGMLHIEIVSERLRREYGLNLIISTPSVEYRVIFKNGKTESIRSASAMPDQSRIENIEEPVVNMEILSPAQYLGPLMKLVAELRNQYIATDYLGKETVVLKYIVPLAEIVTDFYDKLKSVSSGYASMSYEPAGWQAGDLVRLDILVAGEPVEPFAKIVPHQNAYYEGRAVVEKLKNIIPPQLFAVSLQAAIGGKIIARETLKARRKDVTGYLYGGDVTRKKKLLEKQKKGKKKMKELGRVNIPQKVFLEMLKK